MFLVRHDLNQTIWKQFIPTELGQNYMKPLREMVKKMFSQDTSAK